MMYVGYIAIVGDLRMELNEAVKKFKAFGYVGTIHVDLKDLKRRYRVLSKKYHPDICGDDKVFLDIKDSYDKLVCYIEDNKLEKSKINLTETLATVRHGEFAFRYLISGVEYRL